MWPTIVRSRLFWCAACLGLFAGAVFVFAAANAPSRAVGGPGTDSGASWADVLVLNGRTYQRSMDVPAGEQWLQPADLGAAYATIQVRLADHPPSVDYVMQDGEAGVLPVGTTVYEVKGYAPTFRLAAAHQGERVLYEVLFDPDARHGHEVLDIGGKVREIEVQPSYAGEGGRITDPAQIERLVNMIVQSPVGGPAHSPGERGYHLVFYLHDGTLVSRGYNWDANLLGGIVPPPALRGITPPPAFQTELEQAVSRFVTVTPQAATPTIP